MLSGFEVNGYVIKFPAVIVKIEGLKILYAPV
jgi:hypothetical protein